jgi:hypothetical protein
MNRCPNCAAQNREGAKFCTSCGFRLPAEAPVLATSDRSPFATTSSMPGQSEATPAAEPSSFETWNTETTAARGPGGSWEAEPLPNRAIPVDDDMLASLVGSAESHESPGSAEPAPNTADWNLEAGPVSSTAASTSIEHLLKLARDLEYGLIELAEAPGAAEEGAVATGSLRGVLDALQDEDDLIALRSAVSCSGRMQSQRCSGIGTNSSRRSNARSPATQKTANRQPPKRLHLPERLGSRRSSRSRANLPTLRAM